MALMAEIGNINILVGEEVAGAVSAELENVPWDKAFNALLDLKSYAADIDVASNIIRVSTPSNLTSQESYKSARASAVKKKVELEDSVEPIISEIFRLYYICSIFYHILFYAVYLILFCSVLFCSVLFHSVLCYSILF